MNYTEEDREHHKNPGQRDNHHNGLFILTGLIKAVHFFEWFDNRQDKITVSKI